MASRMQNYRFYTRRIIIIWDDSRSSSNENDRGNYTYIHLYSVPNFISLRILRMRE